MMHASRQHSNYRNSQLRESNEKFTQTTKLLLQIRIVKTRPVGNLKK